ncbi:MAG: hypothetical protein AAFN94_09150 [Pseudomonadota bacterium]
MPAKKGVMGAVFFIIGKISGAIILPDIVVLLGFAPVLILIWVDRTRSSFVLFGGMLPLGTGIAVFPVADVIFKPLEAARPAFATPTAILVPGGAGVDFKQSRNEGDDAADRILAAVALAIRVPEARVESTSV